MAKKKVEPRIGDVFVVPLSDGKRGYGQVLGLPLAGFFALSLDRDPELSEILSAPVAFRCNCMLDAIREGEWPILGNAPLPPAMKEPLRLWRQTSPGFVFLYEWTPEAGGDERRASPDEVRGLEKELIWDSRGIPDRIEMALRGEPYPFVEIAP